MEYNFLVDTYETERIKILSVWSMFEDDDLFIRPHPLDRRDRNPLEHMIHQCMSEDKWFCNMFGIDVGAPPLPEKETRLEFIKRYAGDSEKRLAMLKEKDKSWVHSIYGPSADTGGLPQNNAKTVYAYPDIPSLIQGESKGGLKALLPGPGIMPCTERPDL
ncbi:MAG: damage-inducible protein DinB [Deltaproteobacteria bacterium]|nr:damage-inducible protein DinB [Deltaproteobacteria bacterium]